MTGGTDRQQVAEEAAAGNSAAARDNERDAGQRHRQPQPVAEVQPLLADADDEERGKGGRRGQDQGDVAAVVFCTA